MEAEQEYYKSLIERLRHLSEETECFVDSLLMTTDNKIERRLTMIFGNIKNLQEYPFLEEQIKKCFTYASDNDLLSFEKGSYEIDGDRLYVNIAEYTTTQAEERFWEAHRKYLDVHLMLRGQEQIDLNFVQNMDVKEYVEESDFLPMDGEKNSSVVLRAGDYLICYPSDGHRTAVAVDEPEMIKKAIFKVVL